VSRYQKGKTSLDFTEARDGEWQGISWVRKTAPRSRQITTPLSFFTGRMPFLPPNQQRQGTDSLELSSMDATNKY